MKIYVGHSSSYNFKTELYSPIRNSALNSKFFFILPHENSNELFSSLEFFKSKSVDLLIAEVSYPSTGLGIELGQASSFNIPIACIYKIGNKYSNAVKALTKNIFEYDEKSLIEVISKIIKLVS